MLKISRDMMSWITVISVVSKAVMALMLYVCDVYHVIISAMYMISSWLRCEWYLWLTWWQCYLWCLWCGDDCDIYYFLDDCITRDVFDVRDVRTLWIVMSWLCTPMWRFYCVSVKSVICDVRDVHGDSWQPSSKNCRCKVCTEVCFAILSLNWG